MAKGTDSGEFVVVVSQVRKRELQFVLKSQSEICGGESLGRTRASRNLNSGSGLVKKMRLTKDEEDENLIMPNTLVSEISDSALVEPEKASLNVEEAKKENSSAIGREIVIACPAGLSELAKMASRSCHVKLERVLDYDKPCRRLTRSMLKHEGNNSEASGDEDRINPEREDNCVDASSLVVHEKEEKLHDQNSVDPCVGPMDEPSDSKALVLCKHCLEEPKLHTCPSQGNDALKGSSKPTVVPNTILSRSISSPGRSSRREQPTKKSPEPDVVSGTIRSESKSSSIKSNQGKLTRKDQRLHKLVFEDDILPDGTEVGYFVAGKKMLVGYKKGFGIHCSCCNKVISPSSFEAHAGFPSRRKPFHHIYTTNGVSLHELSVALSMDQRFSIQENDDLCSICKDGGDLLCCDTCPRSFHIACASLPSPPSERWSCKYCVNMVEKEKFVDRNPNAIAAGRVHGVDAIDQITKRCIRIVSSLGSELPSVCVLCRGHSFSRMGFNSRTVILCDQCEKEFHVGCLKEHNIADLKELPEEQWFCSDGCKKINTSLANLILHGEEKLSSNLLVNFIKKKQNPNEESCPVDSTTPEIRWRVLSGKSATSEDTKSLLVKAVSILHERFDPISDSGTRGDLIPAIVYGRQAKGQDFSGMYCTMLTVDEVIVSVGIFRIFGSELAELPLVATSKDCQGQGYFQCLFACIQRLLGFLNVKHLVLPAADEAKSIWTDKFGFTKMTNEEVSEYRKDFSVMVFHGTSMLRKTVPAPRVASKQEDSIEQ